MANRMWTALTVLGIVAVTGMVSPGLGSDHGDTALLRQVQRHDARLTDLYAFIRGERLVLALCLDPTVPAGATGYSFPLDLTLRIDIDNHSAVSFEDPSARQIYGGTVVDPPGIAPDITFLITFRRGAPDLDIYGLPGRVRKELRFFAGLRDDPFIRGPREGANVAAIVLDLPVGEVVEPHGTLLVWATSKVPEIRGQMADLAGRALRSQFPENEPMNLMPPRDQQERMGIPPDVLIFDTSRHAEFPNGRELTDDVVDLVGDARVLADDTPFPSMNDVPFLDEFPYLAPPQGN